MQIHSSGGAQAKSRGALGLDEIVSARMASIERGERVLVTLAHRRESRVPSRTMSDGLWDATTNSSAICSPAIGRANCRSSSTAASSLPTTCPTASRATTMMNCQSSKDGPTTPDFRRWMGCRFMSQNQRLARLANTRRAVTRICSDHRSVLPGPGDHGSGTCQVARCGGCGLSRTARHLGTVLRGSAS